MLAHQGKLPHFEQASQQGRRKHQARRRNGGWPYQEAQVTREGPMKIRTSIAAAGLAALATTAAADNLTGTYAGALAGQTRLDDGDVDYKKFTWGFFVGHQFNENAALELGFYKPRAIKDTVYIGTTPIDFTATYSVFALSVLGSVPFSETWSGYARAGVASSKLKLNATSGSQSASDSDTSTDFVYGVGISAALQGVKLRFEYTRITADTKPQTLSVSLAWYFRPKQ
jgi:OmpA-OmpF porin, OOP family